MMPSSFLYNMYICNFLNRYQRQNGTFLCSIYHNCLYNIQFLYQIFFREDNRYHVLALFLIDKICNEANDFCCVYVSKTLDLIEDLLFHNSAERQELFPSPELSYDDFSAQSILLTAQFCTRVSSAFVPENSSQHYYILASIYTSSFN